MSELIRKSELLEKLNDSYELNWTDDDDYITGFNSGLGVAIEAVEELQPVNAVELPCKIGDMVYEFCKPLNKVYSYEITGFTIKENALFINCYTHNYYFSELGVKVFLSREEAEKALEDLKND